MSETYRKRRRNSWWAVFCCRAIALLALGSPALARSEGVWAKVDEVKMEKDALRIVLSFHNGGPFKGCSNFAIEIERYAWFKWDVLARLTRRQRPEREIALPELRAQLLVFQRQPIYVAEIGSLKRVDACRFSADAAVLEGKFLYVFFKLA
jgi:hypothetical protein